MLSQSHAERVNGGHAALRSRPSLGGAWPFVPSSAVRRRRSGAVTYADGTPNTVDQETRDVVTFLAWAAEPKMEERKRTGFNVMLFPIGFTVLLYLTYRRVWHGQH